MKKLKNQQLFLDLSDNWVYRANHCPHLERQVNTKNHELLKEKPTSRNICGNSVYVKKTKLWLGNCGRLNVDNSELKILRESSHGRHPYFCKSYLKAFDQVPTVNIREKSPLASVKERSNHSEIHQRIFVSRLALKRNHSTRA